MESENNPLFYQTRRLLPKIAKAEGIYMYDENGKVYIDASSGAIISNIGHADKRVLQKIEDQAQKTFFAYRTHFENQPAIDLANKIISRMPAPLNRVFYVSGGSEAVETAMKLCRQYHYSRGEGSRHLFISRTPGYHGCTLGALGITSYAPLENPFRSIVKHNPRIPAPFCYHCAYDMTYPACEIRCARDLEEAILANGPENIAAFVAEPIGGASTGATVPPDDYFSIVRDICTRYGVMLILDEVMTGFGRTGKFFGFEHFEVTADVIALSKGMASGYFPLGAAVATDEIVETILDSGGFQHGHTYAGNPMACAVGEAVFDAIVGADLVENARAMGDYLKKELNALKDRYPIIGDVRGKGLLMAIELVWNRELKTPFPNSVKANLALADEAYKNGLIIYPRKSMNGIRGDHLMVSPPLIVTREQVDDIIEKLDDSLKVTQQMLLHNRN